MSANTIIDTAPLGAFIRYGDGNPKPPARFTKKLAAWERSNGVGRLVKKEPPRPYSTWTPPASFTLHEGNFSSDGVILVTIMPSHSADSLLRFEVIEVPKVGQVCVLLDLGAAPSFCIWRRLSRRRSFGLPRRAIATRGSRSSATKAMGQGSWDSPGSWSFSSQIGAAKIRDGALTLPSYSFILGKLFRYEGSEDEQNLSSHLKKRYYR